MSLLASHLEQISLSAAAIAELPFLPPKVFTNALLHSHDITALIRDTEPHERALFTSGTLNQSKSVPRRSTVYGSGSNNPIPNNAGLTREGRHSSMVDKVLGPVLASQTKRDKANDGRESGEIDVEVLLKGAERLCEVYPMPGVREKIGSLRMRYEKISSSILHYESLVSQQTLKLGQMKKSKGKTDGEDDLNVADMQIPTTMNEECPITPEDLEREAEEIRELEQKRIILEARIKEMEMDLGGLSR